MVQNISKDKLTLFLIGDSTMADKPNPDQNPERGWGQILPMFFDDHVKIQNFAVNGRSSKSFIDEGRWGSVLAEMRSGDYVFIQFGHNDQKNQDPTRYTNPYTGYRRNLEHFVITSRASGGFPVLFSSIVRRSFNQYGVLEDTHGSYPFVTRAVADALWVPFIDLQLMTEDLVLRLGVEQSKELYMWLEPDQWDLYPQGAQDDTHLSVAGAMAVARLATEGLRQSGVPLSQFIVHELTETRSR